jgi:hypothetical protein
VVVPRRDPDGETYGVTTHLVALPASVERRKGSEQAHTLRARRVGLVRGAESRPYQGYAALSSDDAREG